MKLYTAFCVAFAFFHFNTALAQKESPVNPSLRTALTESLGEYRVTATREDRDGAPWITVIIEKPASAPLIRYSDLKITALATLGKEVPVRQAMEARFLADTKTEKGVAAKAFFTTAPETLKTLTAVQIAGFGGSVKLAFEQDSAKVPVR